MTTSGVPRCALEAGRRVAMAVLAAAVAASAVAGAAAGASPAASAGSLPTRDSLGQIEVWLDADFITPDAPPGGTLQAGFTFWDLGQLTLKAVDGVYVRLRPAKGSAAPSEGRVRADFAGHVVADLVVPKGGPGTVQVGIHGRSCDASGTCTPADIPLPIAGTGPPTGAPALELVSGSIHDIVGDIVTARPFSVTADVVPRGLWDVRSVGLPDTVDVIAFQPNDPTGAMFGSGSLQRQGDVGTPYTGTMTVRTVGTLELAVALHLGGAGLVIAGDRKPITVLEAGVRPSTGPAASNPAAPPDSTPAGSDSTAPSGGIPVIVWVVAVLVVIVGGGALLLRLLADQ